MGKIHVLLDGPCSQATWGEGKVTWYLLFVQVPPTQVDL